MGQMFAASYLQVVGCDGEYRAGRRTARSQHTSQTVPAAGEKNKTTRTHQAPAQTSHQHRRSQEVTALHLGGVVDP